MVRTKVLDNETFAKGVVVFLIGRFGLIFRSVASVLSSLCWWAFSLMAIIESFERTLLSLSPYIKCQKMCVSVIN